MRSLWEYEQSKLREPVRSEAIAWIKSRRDYWRAKANEAYPFVNRPIVDWQAFKAASDELGWLVGLMERITGIVWYAPNSPWREP